MMKNLTHGKFSLSAVLAMVLAIALLFSTPLSALAAAPNYTADELGIKANTVYDFNDGKALSEIATYVDGNDNTNWFGKTEVKDNLLYVHSKGLTGSKVLFDTKGNIQTYSFDINWKDGTYSTKIVYFYDDVTGKYSALDIMYSGTTMSIRPVDSDAGKTINTQLLFWTDAAPANNWYTITLTYGTTYDSVTHNSFATKTINSKYLTEIKVTKKGESVATLDVTSATTYKRACAYGVDRTSDANATDSNNIKVGFMDNGTVHQNIDNMIVTYNNIPAVQKLIDEIGEIEYTPACLEKIQKAEAAYNMLSAEQKEQITYDFEAAYDRYYAVGREELGLRSDTIYNFNDGKALSEIATYVDGTDNTNKFGNAAVKDNLLYVHTAGGVGSKLLFDASGNIKTYSFDVNWIEGTYSTKIVYFYDNVTGKYSAFDLMHSSGEMSIRPVDSEKNNTINTKLLTWNDTAPANNWYTITLTYGTTYESVTHGSFTTTTVNSKYLTEIKVTKNGSEVAALDVTSASTYKRAFAYGVDRTNNATATDSDDIKIGFADNGYVHQNIDNMKVTYDNIVVVQSLIDEIGEVAYTEACLEKIQKAEAAYDMLTISEQLEIDYDFDAAYDKYYELGRIAVGLKVDTVYDFNDGKALSEIATYVDGNDSNNYMTSTAIKDNYLYVYSKGLTGSKVLFDTEGDLKTYSFDINWKDGTYSTKIVYFYDNVTGKYSAFDLMHSSGEMSIRPVDSDAGKTINTKLLTWNDTAPANNWYTILKISKYIVLSRTHKGNIKKVTFQ